jgi:hypothetical protein
MKWTPWLFGSLTAVLIAGCNGDRRDTGAAAGAGTDTMQTGATGTATDTGMSATDTAAVQPGDTSSDTARSGARMHTDSAHANQTKPGVTDTIRSGGDSVPSSNQ